MGHDVTLICSGTGGKVADEDVIGAGALIDRLRLLGEIRLQSDGALRAWNAFLRAQHERPSTLRETEGGRNIIAAGLEGELDFAAHVDRFDIVARVLRDPLRVVKVS